MPLSEFFRHSVSNNFTIQIGCMLFERQFLISNNLCFDEQLNYSEDFLFYIDLYCCEGTIIETPPIILHYIQRTQGAMSSGIKEKRILDNYRVAEIIQEKIRLCQNLDLIECLEGILAMYYYLVDDDIKKITIPKYINKYKNLITDEMREFYIKKGVMQRPTEIISNKNIKIT